MLSQKHIVIVLSCLLILWGNLSFAQAPTDILLSNHNIPENEDLYTFISVLSAIDANQASGHQFHLVEGEEDNAFFRIRGDSLFSFFSFNFEKKNNYSIRVKTNDTNNNIFIKYLNIYVVDVTGKYDQNGIADADIANKYPQVNIGDYIYFNGVGNNRAIYAQNNGFPTINYPNKVLIRGDSYQAIVINASQINGENSNKRVAISNFMGQVYVLQYFVLNGGNFWRLTGAYEPSMGLGSIHYKGCHQNNSSVDFGFSNGKYGIWISREWVDEGNGLVKVAGTATGFKIDHLEISDGGFAGLMIKYDNMNIHSMDDVEIDHLYIHDIGSEGMYIGSTQSEPQHLFNNLYIHHCAVLRTGGEAIQIGQQSGGCLVENNVLWGSFDWLSPFNRWQDNVFQLDARNGDITIRNNIVMGAAGNAFNAFNRPKEGITPNGLPITFENNLIWCSRSNVGIYQGGASDGITPWVWKNNYAGKFFFDWDRVYNRAVNYPEILFIGMHRPTINVNVTGNRFDNTRRKFQRLFGNGNVQIFASDNIQKALPNPQFRHFLEATDDFNYLKWTRWTAYIGESLAFPARNTNKGQTVTYTLGDVVQYPVNGRSRFYKCLQTHTLQKPEAEGNAYWELLTWNNNGTISYLPPDDVRLDIGSFYYTKNIGLEVTETNFVVDAGADQSQYAPVDTITYEGNAYSPNSSISSYQWTQIEGNSLTLGGQNTQYLSCINPIPGTYAFILTATTASGLSKTDTVLLSILVKSQAPIADAGIDARLPEGTTSSFLDGSASSDPNHKRMNYQWRLIAAEQHPLSKTFINFTNNYYQANSPWNNSDGKTASGTIITNLLDSLGDSTSIGIEVLGDWSGLNTGGMVTSNNDGVFPNRVIKTSYYFQTGTRQLRVFGLNPNELYNFEFFGSKYGNGDRTTIYSIKGKSTSLNATFNSTNTTSLNWVEADHKGEIFIQITKADGVHYGYLNALVIGKSNLKFDTSTDSDPEIRGLNNGLYSLELKVTDTDNLSDLDTVSISIDSTNVMKKTFINFTNNYYQANSPWNNSDGTTASGTIITNLLDSLGDSTSIGIEVLGDWSGLNTGGMITSNNDGVFPNRVIKTSYYFQTGTRQLRVFGLNPNELYHFEFFGSKYGAGDRTAIYSIGNKSTSLNATFNSTNTTNLDDIKADYNGEIVIHLTRAERVHYGYLNALIISATNVTSNGANSSTRIITKPNNDLGDIVSKIAKLTDKASIGKTSSAESSIFIYPNPSTNWVTLSIDDYKNPLQCHIHTFDGQTIHEQSIVNAQTNFNIQDFPTGIYLVDLRNEQGHLIWRTKLIKW